MNDRLLLVTRDGSTQIVIWSLVLMGVIVFGLLIVMRLKKKLIQVDEPGAGGGFTLSDLRQLHKSGKMSAEEFEKAKAQIVMLAKAPRREGSATAPIPPAGGRQEPAPTES